MKLIDNPKTNKLVESFQANDTKFAFATENTTGDFQLIHTWVKCREYFNELLMKNYHSDEFSFHEVHGFEYEHGKFPMDLSRTILAMKFPSKESMEQFTKNMDVIHKIEEQNDLVERTVIHTVTTHDNTLLLIASKFWIQKALLLNIYTLILKLMCFEIKENNIAELYKTYNDLNKQAPSELSYCTQIGIPKINKLLQNLDVIALTSTKYVDGSNEIRPAYTIHASSGILALVKFGAYGMDDFITAIKKILSGRKAPMSILS